MTGHDYTSSIRQGRSCQLVATCRFGPGYVQVLPAGVWHYIMARHETHVSIGDDRIGARLRLFVKIISDRLAVPVMLCRVARQTLGNRKVIISMGGPLKGMGPWWITLLWWTKHSSPSLPTASFGRTARRSAEAAGHPRCPLRPSVPAATQRSSNHISQRQHQKA